MKLISYDDKSEPSTAVRDFLRLAEKDRVDFLLSAHGSELSFAVAKIAETNKTPMTIYAGYANKIWTQGYKWIFNVGPTASEYCEPFVYLVKGLPAKHKVGLIAEDGLWAKAVSESMVKVAKKEGLDFEIVDVYPADSKDVSSSVNKVIAANCDIIGTVSHVRNDLLFTRTIIEMGVRNKFKVILGPHHGRGLHPHRHHVSSTQRASQPGLQNRNSDGTPGSSHKSKRKNGRVIFQGCLKNSR